MGDHLPRLDVVPRAHQEAERQLAHDLDRDLGPLAIATNQDLATRGPATSRERDLRAMERAQTTRCPTSIPGVVLPALRLLDRDVDALTRLQNDPRTAQSELGLECHISDLTIRLRSATHLLELLNQSIADRLVVRDGPVAILASLGFHQGHDLVVEPLEEVEDDVVVVEERRLPPLAIRGHELIPRGNHDRTDHMRMVQAHRDGIEERRYSRSRMHLVEEVADRADLVVRPQHELVAVSLTLGHSDGVGHLAHILDLRHTFELVSADLAGRQLELATTRVDHGDGLSQVRRQLLRKLVDHTLERAVVPGIHVRALANVLPGKARAVPLDDAVGRDLEDPPAHVFTAVPHLDQLFSCVRDPVQGVLSAPDRLHGQASGMVAEGLGALASLAVLVGIVCARGLVQAHDIREARVRDAFTIAVDPQVSAVLAALDELDHDVEITAGLLRPSIVFVPDRLKQCDDEVLETLRVLPERGVMHTRAHRDFTAARQMVVSHSTLLLSF